MTPTQPPSSSSLPLLLTIRFSNSLPDIDLDILSPRTTTVLSLKHLLRNRLSTKSRLRLIYQGRLLPDSSALSAVLKAPLTHPPPSSSSENASGDSKGKGKSVARIVPRIYVNCSISDDALSSEDLAAESTAAELPPESTNDPSSSNPVPSVRPRPKGFDRLLQSGFTQSEISTLRTQFATVHADRFTPDAPPSPDTIRSLEDAWIDSNAGEALSTSVGSGGAVEGDDFAGMASLLDTLIKGMMVGFFFPLGSITWLLREEVWSDQWRLFVGGGVMFSLTIGVIMGISGN